MKKGIDRGKRSKTLGEVEPVENIRICRYRYSEGVVNYFDS